MATIAQLLGVVEKLSFFESAILNFFCIILIQISHNLWDTKNFFEIFMITLISSKNLGGDRNMNNNVPGSFLTHESQIPIFNILSQIWKSGVAWEKVWVQLKILLYTLPLHFIFSFLGFTALIIQFFKGHFRWNVIILYFLLYTFGWQL